MFSVYYSSFTTQNKKNDFLKELSGSEDFSNLKRGLKTVVANFKRLE